MPGPTSRPGTTNTGPVEFAKAVASGTGFSFATVAAWVRAENGANNNFLGLENTGGQLETFPDWQTAATATIARLQESKYSSLLAAAKANSDPTAQLTAIAQSDWLDGKAGSHPSYLHLLLGALSANGDNPAGNTDFSGANQGVDFSGVFGGIESWIQSEATTALAYVVFTVLGLVLFAVGLLEVLGYSPSRVAGNAGIGGGAKAAAEVIPF